MEIYPDSELPDIVASWDEFSCHEGTRDARFTVTSVDGLETIAETTVECSAFTVRFDDLARERYFVIGELLDLGGETFSLSQAEADLRDGLSERVPVYFNGATNVRVQWMFESGTCASNDADTIELELAYMSSQTFSPVAGGGCAVPRIFATLPEGMHRVRLRASNYSGPRGRTVALSPVIDVTVVADEVNDLGSVMLSPCSPDCDD